MPPDVAAHGARFQESLRRVLLSARSSDLQHGARWLLYCAAVGVVAGIGALLFDLLSGLAVHGFLERLVGWTPDRPAGEEPLFDFAARHRHLTLLLFVPAIGGLLSAVLVRAVAPEAAGHGTDAAIEAYHCRGGWIRPRVPLVKIIASAITLGSGGSGGREGPIAQAGAGVGSFIASRLRLSSDDRRILMAAGMGAGIGSIFRAPLAGALFAAEILYSSAEFEASVLIPACVASIVAYCTFTLAHGTGSLFQTPALSFSNPAELAAYVVLALVLVAFGFVYVRTFTGVHAWFQRWRIPPVFKPAAGGLLTGALGLLLITLTGNEAVLAVLSFGYGVLQKALDAPVTLASGAGIFLLVAVGKILTTSLSIGSGGSAGVFGPSMVIGGCVGGAVGLTLHGLMPALVQQPATYVVVGMAGFFSGVAKTPISTLVMVSEMTGSYSLLLPSMWVCVLTFAMSRRWNLYSSQVPTRVDSAAHQGRFAVDVLRGIRVAEILDPGREILVFGVADSLRQALAVAAASSQSTFPVLDTSGNLVGVISLDELRLTINEQLPPELLVYDLMITDCPILSPESDSSDALRVLASVALEEVPVWDAQTHRLAGLLSRRRLTRAYLDRTSRHQQSRAS